MHVFHVDTSLLKKQRIKWIASGVRFSGKPFILVGDKRYDCRHGKDKNIAKKEQYNKRRHVRLILYHYYW